MKNGNSICLRTVDPAYRPMERALSCAPPPPPSPSPTQLGQSTGVVRAHRLLVPACVSVPPRSCWLPRASRRPVSLSLAMRHPWGRIRVTRCSGTRQFCTMVGPHDLLTPRDVLAAAVMHLSGGPVCACVRREVLRTFGPAFVAG